MNKVDQALKSKEVVQAIRMALDKAYVVINKIPKDKYEVTITWEDGSHLANHTTIRGKLGWANNHDSKLSRTSLKSLGLPANISGNLIWETRSRHALCDDDYYMILTLTSKHRFIFHNIFEGRALFEQHLANEIIEEVLAEHVPNI